MNRNSLARKTRSAKQKKPDALKRCPFCGGRASDTGKVHYSEHFAKEQGWPQATFYFCNCMMCSASNQGLRGYESQAAAIAAWNRRSR